MSTNARMPEQRESSVDLAADDVRVRAGFRVVSDEMLAGGPVELEFFVESLGSSTLRLAVSGDRMRQRPGQFTFVATFEGAPLEDPLASLPDMGGPEGLVPVTTGNPWRQPLVLNQFIRLELTPERLAQGATGQLNLTCRRPLVLAATDAAALSRAGARDLSLALAIDLRRDDAALAALADRLLDDVMQGPPASRERPLVLLLSMRSAAQAQIDALTRHPDAAVADRARQVRATFV